MRADRTAATAVYWPSIIASAISKGSQLSMLEYRRLGHSVSINHQEISTPSKADRATRKQIRSTSIGRAKRSGTLHLMRLLGYQSPNKSLFEPGNMLEQPRMREVKLQ